MPAVFLRGYVVQCCQLRAEAAFAVAVRGDEIQAFHLEVCAARIDADVVNLRHAHAFGCGEFAQAVGFRFEGIERLRRPGLHEYA